MQIELDLLLDLPGCFRNVSEKYLAIGFVQYNVHIRYSGLKRESSKRTLNRQGDNPEAERATWTGPLPVFSGNLTWTKKDGVVVQVQRSLVSGDRRFHKPVSCEFVACRPKAMQWRPRFTPDGILQNVGFFPGATLHQTSSCSRMN